MPVPPPVGGAARLISSEPFGTVLFGPLASPFPLPSLVGAGLGGGVEIKVDLFSQSAACAMGPYCCKSVSIFIIVSHSAGKCCHSFLVGVRFFGSGRLDLRTLNRLVREAWGLPFDDVRLHEKSSSSVWSQRTGVAVGG